MTLVELIYSSTKMFPAEEIYGLTSQIRRCSISIPSNIAEGYGRNSTGDYIRFLKIASGSLYEFQTQLEISLRLSYINEDDFVRINDLSIEAEKMLSSLIRKINESKRRN